MAQYTVNYEELEEKKKEIAYYRFSFFCNEIEDDDGKKPLNISPYVKFFYIEQDYEVQKFPIVKVKLVLPKKHYLLMYEKQEKITFTLKVTRYKRSAKKKSMDDILLTEEKMPMSELEPYKDLRLKPIGRPFKQIEQDNDNGNIKKGAEDFNLLDGDSGGVDNMFPQHEVDLYLFKEEHLLFNKVLNSFVFHNTNLCSVILFLIQRNGVYKDADIYVGHLDNQQMYEQIIIPPLNFYDALYYLQRVYGLYNNGLQVFADFKNLFIEDLCKVVNIPTKKRGHSKALLEFYSDKDKDTDFTRSNLTWFSDKKNCYIIRTTMRPVPTNRNSEEQEITGEKTTFTSSSIVYHFLENKNTDMKCGHEKNNQVEKEGFFWNPYSHTITESEFKINSNRSMFNIKTFFRDSCLEAFILNREYNATDYAKNIDININGKYKIVSNHCIITNKGGAMKQDMDCTVQHNCVFKKIDMVQ